MKRSASDMLFGSESRILQDISKHVGKAIIPQCIGRRNFRSVVLSFLSVRISPGGRHRLRHEYFSSIRGTLFQPTAFFSIKFYTVRILEFHLSVLNILSLLIRSLLHTTQMRRHTVNHLYSQLSRSDSPPLTFEVQWLIL